MANMSLIYHLAPATHWYSWPENKPYLPAEYDKNGFIHCTSTDEVMIKVANHFHRNVPGDYVLLVIDTMKFKIQHHQLNGNMQQNSIHFFHIFMVLLIVMLLLEYDLYNEQMMEHLSDGRHQTKIFL